MFSVADILDSGGRYPDRSVKATAVHITNAEILCDRVNSLFRDIGVNHKPQITSGLRIVPGKGATRSAHLEGMAVDFIDHKHEIALRITRDLLLKHKLRREDTDYTQKLTANGIVYWCHLDSRMPYGRIFIP